MTTQKKATTKITRQAFALQKFRAKAVSMVDPVKISYHTAVLPRKIWLLSRRIGIAQVKLPGGYL